MSNGRRLDWPKFRVIDISLIQTQVSADWDHSLLSVNITIRSLASAGKTYGLFCRTPAKGTPNQRGLVRYHATLSKCLQNVPEVLSKATQPFFYSGRSHYLYKTFSKKSFGMLRQINRLNWPKPYVEFRPYRWPWISAIRAVSAIYNSNAESGWWSGARRTPDSPYVFEEPSQVLINRTRWKHPSINN